ncbi:T9SS sorting signal type C domain-containing protein [Flavobacterium orientale]|nr:T9SS sorting signal type C domain-containing protein [Flavobacterium orientale]
MTFAKVTETDLVNVTVYDLSGRVIATRGAFNSNEASLSLGMLSNQVVLVKVVTTSGEMTQKVLW